MIPKAPKLRIPPIQMSEDSTARSARVSRLSGKPPSALQPLLASASRRQTSRNQLSIKEPTAETEATVGRAAFWPCLRPSTPFFCLQPSLAKKLKRLRATAHSNSQKGRLQIPNTSRKTKPNRLLGSLLHNFEQPPKAVRFKQMERRTTL